MEERSDLWPSSSKTLETIFNPEEEQEGTRTKKGTYMGEMESKKEASVTGKWKESEKNRSTELCS